MDTLHSSVERLIQRPEAKRAMDILLADDTLTSVAVKDGDGEWVCLLRPLRTRARREREL